MNARGILNSTMTADRASQIRTELIPKYEQVAWERYNQNIANQLKRVDVVQSDYDNYLKLINNSMNVMQNISSNTWKVYENNLELMNKKITMGMQADRNAVETQITLYQKAMDRINTIGYVDNEASLMTGLPVGTLSQEAKKYNQQRADNFTKMAIEQQQRIDEQKAKNEANLVEIREKQRLKEEEEARKANAGKLMAFLANTDPQSGLDYINKNYNELQSATGGELLTVVDNLQKARERQIDNARQDRRIEFQETQANRREDRADARARMQAEKENKKNADDEYKDFVDDMKNEIKAFKENATKEIVVGKNERQYINYWQNTYSAERKQAFDFIFKEAQSRGIPSDVAAAIAKMNGLSEFLRK